MGTKEHSPLEIRDFLGVTRKDKLWNVGPKKSSVGNGTKKKQKVQTKLNRKGSRKKRFRASPSQKRVNQFKPAKDLRG